MMFLLNVNLGIKYVEYTKDRFNKNGCMWNTEKELITLIFKTHELQVACVCFSLKI